MNEPAPETIAETAEDGAWGVDDRGQAVHLPSYKRGVEFVRQERNTYTHPSYRILFPGTELPQIKGNAENLSAQIISGLRAAPAIWALAVLEQQMVSTSYEPWTVAACDPEQWRHLGPWKIARGFSEVEECQTCHTQIGK